MGILDIFKPNFKKPEGRVEGVSKVTGSGKYAAEYNINNICYGVLVGSTIPSGKILSFDLNAAKQADGVIDIITHQNKPLVPGLANEAIIKETRFGLPIFHTDKVYFKEQPIALVIAETLEEATFAASLVKAEYQVDKFTVDFESARKSIELITNGEDRGKELTWEKQECIIDQEYIIQAEVHNPMEMHATIAHWTSDNKLRLYEKTQGVNNVQRTFAKMFNIPNENVEVISEFVGGGFGSGLRVWPASLAAIMGSKQVARPVKLMLTRPQMFAATGYRPASWQRVKLGADKNGFVKGVLHQAKNASSVYENFNDGLTRVTRLMYQFPNLRTEASNVPLNMSTPTWMRGPGDCTGAFAIESALDELSYQLNIDPIELRLKNLSMDKHPDSGLPWSSHFLDEGLKKGAEMIHWEKRNSIPKNTIEGDWYIGYGMAAGMWNAGRNSSHAGVVLHKDGSLIVQTAMTDIGTGTGTGMQNIAHEITGISKNKIHIELGNTKLPPAPSQGGSTGLSSLTGAVYDVCLLLKLKLVEYASNIHESFKNLKPEDILLSENSIYLKKDHSLSINFDKIFEQNNLENIQLALESKPGDERKKFAFCCSSAHFCKVRVNKRTGIVKIEKLAVVADGGRIINHLAAANQMSGAAVGGIGMALMEENAIDHNLGTLIGNDLAGYHFSVNADAPIIDVAFINKPDPNSNQLGTKGLGEVGIIGTAPAIANAIYNAIGLRMRNLPITPDKILKALAIQI